MRRLFLAAVLGGALATLHVAPALADSIGVFGPIELVSSGALAEGQQPQQSDYANEPAISGDGHYVAMHGSFAGVSGVWRRDISSGSVELVAPGDATLPSISEEGRYISFTTTRRLVPGDTNSGPDVYVRDMDKAYAESCTPPMVSAETCPYRLVSAVSGSEQAISYEPEEALTGEALKTFEAENGSIAVGRSAMSASGRYVVFETTAESDLAGAHTPAMQIAVRDLQTQTTELVTADSNPETGEPITTGSGASLRDLPVPILENHGAERFGAVFPGGVRAPRFAVLSELSETAPEGASTFGAAISADGNAVAWLGQDVAEQTKVLAGERSGLLHTEPEYSEPLWRELHSPTAPIRRIAGTAQPEATKCEETGETKVTLPATLKDPCQGPFAKESEASSGGLFSLQPDTLDALPRLSANGMTAVFVANAPYLEGGGEFGSAYGSTDDLYVASMQSSLTRVQAVTQLTEVASANATDLLLDAPITDYTISPAGEKVAFTTVRGVFPLQSLSFVSPPLAIEGESELYVIDLQNGTLTRLTHGVGGEEEPSSQPHKEEGGGSEDTYEGADGTFAPSFSANGETLAFSSTANNLVYDDGNTPPEGVVQAGGGADAFVINQIPFTPEPPHEEISPPPPNAAPNAYWAIYATAESAPGGATLKVVVPGAGEVTATGRAPALGTAPATSASAVAAGAGTVALHLQLAAGYVRAAHGKPVTVSVRVGFSASGHKPLAQELSVTLRPPASSAASRRHVKRHRRRRRRRRR